MTGTPRLLLDVGGSARYASYVSGTGTSALTFSYALQTGDLDLDGITLSSPLDLNGGTLKDLKGNNLSPLTFSTPNTSGIKISYPSLGMNFVDDADGRYSYNGTVYNDLASFLAAAGGTFSRPSTATYFDSTGTLQVAGTNAPRFDTDPATLIQKGLLIEEGRTNYIKNSQFVGLTIGTSTATGNWGFAQPPSGLVSITGTGTQYGIPYVDIHFNIGTNATGSTIWPSFAVPSTDQMPVSNGMRTTASAWFGVLSYSSTGGTCQAAFSNRSLTSASGYVSESNVAFSSTASFIYRSTSTLTHSATSAKAQLSVYVTTPNGAACDVTVRLAAPQLEEGFGPTSYIPTTGTPQTRAAESLIIPTGSWYNASAGTLFAEGARRYLGASVEWPGQVSINDTTQNNAIDLYISDPSSDQKSAEIISGGVSQFASLGAAYTSNAVTKTALSFSTNSARAAFDGTLLSLDNSVTLPTLTQMQIGYNRGGLYPWNGTLKTIKYYPSRVLDAQLQLATQ